MLPEIKLELEKLIATQRPVEFHSTANRSGAVVTWRGKKVINFSDFDLLGIRSNPRFKEALHAAIEENALSAGSSRAVSGTTVSHLAAEDRLAKFFGASRALLFSSRNQAVLSIITTLANENDLIFFDELMQSPISDAAYLVNASSYPFSFKGLSNLERELARSGPTRRTFIFAESISPITGETYDIEALAAIATRTRANLVIDESFAVGMLGARGTGALENISAPAAEVILARYVDLSLALASYGAAIIGPELLVSALSHRSRTFSAEISLPPVIASGIETATHLVEVLPTVRQRISSLASRIRRGLVPLKKFSGQDPGTAIVSIPFPKLKDASEMVEGLFQRGFLAEALPVRLPLNGSAVVRLVVNSFHTERIIDELLQACFDVLTRIESDAV